MKMSMLVTPVTILAFNKYGQDIELPHVRIAFVTVVCIAAACIFLIKQAIQQSKDTQPIEFEVKEPGKPTVKATLPAARYDAQELRGLIKKIGIGASIVTVLHLWRGFMQPLVIQCVTIPMTLLESPLFQVYLLNKAPVGKLARPWVEENPLAALMGDSSATTAADSTSSTGPTVPSAPHPTTANGD